MQARIKWLDHMSFVAESGSGHSIVLDGSPDHGGRNLGIRPMESVLIGLGACSAFDVVLMLKKARQNVSDCEVLLEAERADAVPAVFTRVEMVYLVSGTGLSENRSTGLFLCLPRNIARSRRCLSNPSKLLTELSLSLVHWRIEQFGIAAVIRRSGLRVAVRSSFCLQIDQLLQTEKTRN